ncbi:unnamed protein product [Polarella glacialis]|uniref:Uncharacterized protein n=1 Tax=Polarella glacialis TaxID=89957 RepID=A0A813DKD9_POLGL|nr:unnamed protein product [Polarella glacialis]
MALRGFVAASIGYDNANDDLKGDVANFCQVGKTKGNEIVQGSTSALAALCAMAEADCSKGVAVAGHSQGAFITMFSTISDARVTAQLILSAGTADGDMLCVVDAPDRCLYNAQMSNGGLNKAKRRYIIGNDDLIIGGSPANNLQSMKGISGYDCGDSLDCIQVDGSGFFIIKGADYKNATCDKVGHSLYGTIDPINSDAQLVCDWLSPEKFALAANFDWLAATAMTSGAPPTQVSLTFEGNPIPCAASCPAEDLDVCKFIELAMMTLIGGVVGGVVCCCCCVGCIIALVCYCKRK